jgi:hypothetical protein
MTQAMLIWWLFFCLQVFGAVVGYHFGVFDMIIAADPTYISLFILLVHAVTILIIGYYTYKKDLSNIDPLWFVSETQLGLGMVGTLVGFIIMFSGAFSGVISAENIKTIITSIALGVGTAIWTTLVGLSSGLIIKALLVNLEKTNEPN